MRPVRSIARTRPTTPAACSTLLPTHTGRDHSRTAKAQFSGGRGATNSYVPCFLLVQQLRPGCSLIMTALTFLNAYSDLP